MKKTALLSVILLIFMAFSFNVSACDETSDVESADCCICLYENWDNELKEYTEQLCIEKNVPYEIVLGIIWNESRFKSDVVSVYGNYTNYGLMQINANKYSYKFFNERIGLTSFDELKDAKMNILAGVTLLEYCKNYEGVTDEYDMLYAYQNGEGSFKMTTREKIMSNPLLLRVMGKADEYKKKLTSEEEVVVKDELKVALVEMKEAENFFNNANDTSFAYANMNLSNSRAKVDMLIKQLVDIQNKIIDE